MTTAFCLQLGLGLMTQMDKAYQKTWKVAHQSAVQNHPPNFIPHPINIFTVYIPLLVSPYGNKELIQV